MNFGRNEIINYVNKKFGSKPEYLWTKYPDYFIFRHKENKKWYAIIMNVTANKLGLSENKTVDILNVKLDIKYNPAILDLLLGTKGFFPAYHMNKSNWISIILDGSVERQKIINLLNTSYEITK